VKRRRNDEKRREEWDEEEAKHMEFSSGITLEF
jgi:hypothetical protein